MPQEAGYPTLALGQANSFAINKKNFYPEQIRIKS